jgi:hypothetical protein
MKSAELFWDNMDIISDTPLRTRALITMLPGKRRQAVRYRPNHNFGAPENRYFYIGQVHLGEDQWLNPNEPKEAVVEFFNVRGLRELLVPGAVLRLQEGATHVGNAQVIESVQP